MRDLTFSLVLGVLLMAMVASGCAKKAQPTPEDAKARAWVTEFPEPNKLRKWAWMDDKSFFKVRPGAIDEAIAKLESRSFLELDSNAVGGYVGKVRRGKRGKFYLVRCVQSVNWHNRVQVFQKEGRLAIACIIRRNGSERELLRRRCPVVVVLPDRPSEILVGMIEEAMSGRRPAWWRWRR